MENFEESVETIESEIAELEKLNADPNVQFDNEIAVKNDFCLSNIYDDDYPI